MIGAEPDEIVFTSGATEAINLALKGTFERYGKSRHHIVTIATEHSAVLDTCRKLSSIGANVTIVPVLADGTLDLDMLRQKITDTTWMVAVMLANNETGVIHPIREIGEMAKEKGALFFSDTTQVPGKLRFDVNEEGIDLCCLSAHKYYGPKGVGALYIRRKNPRVQVEALIHGGGHENGRRSGTLNVPGIVGMGAASELVQRNWWQDVQRISVLRTRLEQGLLDFGNITVNGSTRHRLPNTTNMCFHGSNAASLIKAISPLCVSTGSACSSESNSPSHVLTAMGLSAEMANASLRFSLGETTTEEEIAKSLHTIGKALGK
jgi:cysteine desulfurase